VKKESVQALAIAAGANIIFAIRNELGLVEKTRLHPGSIDICIRTKILNPLSLLHQLPP